MPQYVVIRVAEVPEIGEILDAKVGRFSAENDDAALTQMAEVLQERALGGSVYALVEATAVTRKTVRPSRTLTIE